MIYCVEDERNIRELIVYTLESSGFHAKGLESGQELMQEMEKELPDLVLLDIMLPGEDGLEILSRLKASEVTREIPVIMVTAKGAEYDKVMGLDYGADDYITKPFGMMEFIARVRAVLRRAGKEEREQEVLQIGDLQIQIKQHQVLIGDRKITLTLKEFELLKYLMENQGLSCPGTDCLVMSGDMILTVRRELWTFISVLCARSWQLRRSDRNGTRRRVPDRRMNR